MQRRSFRGSGEPVWVIASSNAGFRLGPDLRTALGPAAIRAASTGRTRDRTRPMLHKRQKALAKAPSTRDPKRTWSRHRRMSAFDPKRTSDVIPITNSIGTRLGNTDSTDYAIRSHEWSGIAKFWQTRTIRPKFVD